MKMDSATKHFICKRCGLYATREQVSDIRYKLNQRERTREDKQDDYLEWWQKSKKEKAENQSKFSMAKKKDEIPDWVTDKIQNAKFEKPEELKNRIHT